MSAASLLAQEGPPLFGSARAEVESEEPYQVAYRGDRAALEFIAFWLSRGTVVAGMNVNVWDVNDDIQSLIRSRREVDLSRLTNPDIPLADA